MKSRRRVNLNRWARLLFDSLRDTSTISTFAQEARVIEWGATDKDLVQSWMAFKELLRLKLVTFAIPTRWHTEPRRNQLENGWKNKWTGVCTNKYFMNRVLTAPEDFRLGHDFFWRIVSGTWKVSAGEVHVTFDWLGTKILYKGRIEDKRLGFHDGSIWVRQ